MNEEKRKGSKAPDFNDREREKILRKNGFRPLDEVNGQGATQRFIDDSEKDLKPFLDELEEWRRMSLRSIFIFDQAA